jgi:hypothetical protein
VRICVDRGRQLADRERLRSGRRWWRPAEILDRPCCFDAIAAYAEPSTTWIHARPSVTANSAANPSTRSRIREFAPVLFTAGAGGTSWRGSASARPSFVAPGLCDFAEALTAASCGGDLRLELGAVVPQAVELDVEPQDENVDRDDAGEQHGDEDDPEHAARERGAADTGAPEGGLRDGRHQAFTAARRRAEAALGLTSVSCFPGARASASTAAASALPQTHRKSGGTQPFACSAMNR